MTDTLTITLAPQWLLNTSGQTTGFYDVITNQTKLPTSTYTISTSGSAYNTTYVAYTSTFTNIETPTSAEDSTISLATALKFNFGGYNEPDYVNYTGYFTITLYPFLNGSNIVINGGAITTATNNVETGYTGGSYTYTGMDNYIVTVLNQSFPSSATDCTLYFKLDPPPTATACNQ